MTSSGTTPQDADRTAGSDDHWSHLRHELRTPLNQIIGYGEMLEEDAEAAGRTEVVADLQRIQRAARSMLLLIETHLSAGTPAMQTLSRQVDVAESGSSPHLPSVDATEPESGAADVQGDVLVIDDNPLNRELLQKRLERRGLRVQTAGDGLEALEMLRQHSFDVVLLDVMMPRLNGYETLQAMKRDERLRHVPVIMISARDELGNVIRCIEAGAEDFLSKPFNPTLLRARINACLEKKRLRDAEHSYLQQIEQTQRRRSQELHDAAEYVRSIFPAPMEQPLEVSWFHQSCSELGGDAFGYHWLDERRFVIYLLDVCGHGVGTSLLAASAINVIRSGSLPVNDPGNPSDVLSALNGMFPMERQNNMYFTLWYGVFDTTTRELRYACAGHPAALLVTNTEAGHRTSERLGTLGMVVGAFDGVEFEGDACRIPPGAELYVISDGCYEIPQADGRMLTVDHLEEFLLRQPTSAQSPEQWFQQSAGQPDSGGLDDDFTMVRIRFL